MSVGHRKQKKVASVKCFRASFLKLDLMAVFFRALALALNAINLAELRFLLPLEGAKTAEAAGMEVEKFGKLAILVDEQIQRYEAAIASGRKGLMIILNIK